MMYWMLKGFVSNRWAAWGAIILLINWRVSRVWGQSYYGTGPALLGATLVFGAWGRLLQRSKLKPGLCLGLGLVTWVITRPYEGLVASIPVMITLVWRTVTAAPLERQLSIRRVLIPVLCLVAVGIGALSWYHQQVTGSLFKWPYRLYEETYTRRSSPAGTVVSWTALGERKRTIPSLEAESTAAASRMAESEPLRFAFRKAAFQWWFHLGVLWTLPLVIAVSEFRRWPNAFAAVTIGLVGVAILLQRTSGMPHYAAPIHPLIILLVVQGLRRMWTYRWMGRRWGKDLVILFTSFSAICYFVPLFQDLAPPTVRNWAAERDRIRRELHATPGKDLVIVRYCKGHSMHEEWVYNQADIDRSEVVWARELKSRDMQELLQYFPDRRVWLIEPDHETLGVKPYRLPAENLEPEKLDLEKPAPTSTKPVLDATATGNPGNTESTEGNSPNLTSTPPRLLRN